MENSKSSGVGFFGWLTLLFIALKLTNFIDWSWWVVLLPAYGGLILVGLFFIVTIIYHGIVSLLEDFFKFLK